MALVQIDDFISDILRHNLKTVYSFLSHSLQKSQKGQIRFCSKKFSRGTRNAIFYAEPKTVEKVVRKSKTKKVINKKSEEKIVELFWINVFSNFFNLLESEQISGFF
jgi:DNA-binding transcriptional regulator GbsR (MarR family)